MATDISTARLRLRTWRPADREPFAALNADAQVMEYFPAPLSRRESDAFVERIEAKFQERGFGLWAVEAPGVAPFVGFIGLSVPSFDTPFTPCVEIGWRLARAYWNQGLATEGAAAVLRHAFGALHLSEVVSFTAAGNLRSRRVMEKLGMHRDAADDFEHPLLPAEHPLRRHVLYRISNPALPNRALEPTLPDGDIVAPRGSGAALRPGIGLGRNRQRTGD
ncbi:MAG: GNAT family N-acetyltransferase [Vicinamibacterales bacterium]